MSTQAGEAPRWLGSASLCVLAALGIGYGAVWAFGGIDPAALPGLWMIPLVGVLGAIIANASGTGGGVVFIPVFSLLAANASLGLTPTGILAASFLIQSFGMSVGSLTWTRRIHAVRRRANAGIPAAQFWGLVALLALIAIPFLWAGQRLNTLDPSGFLLLFKGFSVALGLILLVSTLARRDDAAPRDRLARSDVVVLAMLAPLAGWITALFSVGLGEITALYLFLRGYALNTCSGAAVILSCLSVLAGAPFHVLAGDVPWAVVALAAPGALLGGFIAPRIATWLCARRLKLAVSVWIAGSGLALIAANV